MNKIQKSALIGCGALIFSTLAIQASDLVRGIDGNLANVISSEDSVCAEGASLMHLGDHSICIDTYEASPSKGCPYAAPSNEIETQANANESTCVTQSVQDAVAWRFVSFTQAQQFCARSGKRLPSSEEWYKTAQGITDQSGCVVDAQAPQRTGAASCVTPSGVSDMVGNVWEWVDQEVVNGYSNNRLLPETGYVALVDTDGLIIETANEGDDAFGNDYAWIEHEGVQGMLRGGFYGSGEDAGVFTQNMSVPLDFKSGGVGFRCVRDV